MVSGDTALDISNFTNDTTKAVAGVTITGATSGDTITLSQVTGTAKIKEQIDLASATGNFKVSNLHKAEDTIKFTAGQVNANGTTGVELDSKIGGLADKVIIAKSGDATNAGEIKFEDKAHAGTAIKTLTIDQVRDAIVALEAKSSGTMSVNDVVFYKDAQNIVYLINVGTASDKNDDIIVNLGAMDVAKITADTNVISFA